MSDLKPECQVDFGLNGGSFEFPTVDTAVAFLQNEKSNWAWLLDEPMSDDVGRTLAQHFRDKFSGLERVLKEGSGDDNARLEQFRTKVKQRYANDELIHSSSATANFIRSLAEQEPKTAFLALSWALNRGNDRAPQNRTDFNAVLRFELFRLGLSESAQYETAALNEVFRKFDALRSECRSALNAISDEQSRFGKQNQQFADEWQTATKTRDEEFRTQLSEFTRQHQEQTGSHEERLKQMEATFKERLSLEAPVKFWSDRRWWHNCSAVIYGLVAAAVGVKGFCWLFESATKAVDVAAATTAPDENKFMYLKLVPLTILALGVFWALRILIRLLLSHVHLASDAAERVVMVNTYLALLQSNEAATKEDRHLILQQLFRHAATGVVADDSAPPVPQAEIFKAISGK
jgi:hypothetical protein